VRQGWQTVSEVGVHALTKYVLAGQVRQAVHGCMLDTAENESPLTQLAQTVFNVAEQAVEAPFPAEQAEHFAQQPAPKELLNVPVAQPTHETPPSFMSRPAGQLAEHKGGKDIIVIVGESHTKPLPA
jgi:hypothetical protein